MFAIYGFIALALVALVSGFTPKADNLKVTRVEVRQVALNPQPLPPIEERDAWGFDEG